MGYLTREESLRARREREESYRKFQRAKELKEAQLKDAEKRMEREPYSAAPQGSAKENT